MIKQLNEQEQLNFLGYKFAITNWKTYIQCVTPKLSSACFTIRAVTPLIKTENLKLVYSAHFHSIMLHGIILRGNSTDSKNVEIPAEP
jgi:hypothetical protein